MFVCDALIPRNRSNAQSFQLAHCGTEVTSTDFYNPKEAKSGTRIQKDVFRAAIGLSVLKSAQECQTCGWGEREVKNRGKLVFNCSFRIASFNQ